jgi:hypothetical protein
LDQGDAGQRTVAEDHCQRARPDFCSARAGTLAPAFREGLAVLPGWEGKPRVEADEERWRKRLAALQAYLAAGYDWPRHKAIITGEEHDLGVWLHSQRFKQRRGHLDAGKAAARVGPRAGRDAGGGSVFSMVASALVLVKAVLLMLAAIPAGTTLVD